ncbi:PIR protein [Plasmodium vivax]|uniref:VIR protein n=1 Tax=Plasmodium vivax TaxID=5855 RepID=A0A565A478_PLAVI|nr:PIR protein [Plasmodium vivax]
MASAGTEGDLGKNSIVLFSEKFYNDMNIEDNDLSDYSIYCDSIPWGKNGHEVKKICKKYITYLETSQILNVENPKYDVCILLNYWIYNELTKIFRDEQSLYLIERAFGSLQLVWNNLYLYSRTNHNKCDPKFESVNHKDWENRKKLYDYYVDYDTLSTMARFVDEGCKYYKKIEDKQSLYDHFAELCASEGGDCPDLYKKCESYNPKNVLPKLHCYPEMQKQKVAKESLEQSPEARRDYSGFQGAAASAQDTQSTSQSSGIGKNVAHSVLGSAPVVLTATMLYRYTPLGPWIRRFGGGTTNSMNMMDTLPPYTPETGDIFSDQSAKYISYQPM